MLQAYIVLNAIVDHFKRPKFFYKVFFPSQLGQFSVTSRTKANVPGSFKFSILKID